MTTTKLRSIPYQIIILHIILGIFSGMFFFSEIFVHNSINLWKALETSLIIAIFYIHALVLIPLLLKTNEINKYVLLTFGLFAFSAVLISIFRIASMSDYIYVFTKILYHGPAFGLSIENLYKANFYIALSLFLASFIYGILAGRMNNKVKYFATLVFEKELTEALVHSILLVVLLITSYFAGFFFSNILISCLFLFYFHLLFSSPILVKEKHLKKFLLIVVVEMILFCLLLSFLTSVQLPLLVSICISIMTFSTIYAIIKHQFKENKFLFSQKEKELQQLKSQVNPHFLFNSLNTLYSFALKENAEKTAQNIKKLSNLIRFMLSDIEKDYIPLENEVSYIKDYIDIQLARCSSKQNLEVNFRNIEGYRIAPMLLVPFIENSFKHGINPGEESSLFLNLECSGNTIVFECRNSLKKLSTIDNAEQGLGIGITNVKSRLELIYPGTHSIAINKNTSEFSVKLEINDYSHCS